MLHSGEWLVKKYASLAQPKGNQTLDTTLSTLASRLQDVAAADKDGVRTAPPLPPLADRRAAVLTLKGLARDHPVEVGSKALDAILESLCRDVSEDDEIARAVVEACLTLCEAVPSAGQAPLPQGGRDNKPPQHAINHVERFLFTPGPLHALLPLLSPTRSFYTRFSSLQLLGILLRIRPDRVQEHVLTSPGGCGAILECLSEGSGSSAEIVRNEALLLLPQLVDANADIQKLVAFEGAFEKLIDVVALEGRIEGGVVVQDALEALVALLKYNVSNQNYFRETLSVPLLAPLLFYPPPPAADNEQAEAEYTHQSDAFAFQQWYPPLPPAEDADGEGRQDGRIERDEQKVINASLVLEVAGLLVEGQGESKRLNQNALLSCGFTKCLMELAFASTAPVKLRSQGLYVLAALLRSNRSNQDLINTLHVSPIVQVGSGAPLDAEQSPSYTRLPSRPAILELVGAAVNGTSLGISSATEGLAYRASALDCFEAYVNDNLDARLGILKSMAPPAEVGDESSSGTSGSGPLLLGPLSQFPTNLDASRRADGPFDAYRYLISALLFAHLLRGSETAKDVARNLVFGVDGKVVAISDEKEVQQKRSSDDDDDDERDTLIQILIGNLTMALREHGEATRRERGAGSGAAKGQVHGNAGSPADWTRVQIGYLVVLITWLWESPSAVAELLKESSNLQVLIQPVSQGGNMMDPIVSGLCAVTLGIAYEFGPVGSGQGNEDEGVVSRSTMHPILHSRIGPDQFAARLTRLRDDVRFKDTGPDVLETLSASHRQRTAPNMPAVASEDDEGLWFDWPFVDFIKTNHVLIQKSILVDPASSSASQASQSTELLDAKRQLEQIREGQAKMSRENEHLSQKLKEAESTSKAERDNLIAKMESSQAETEKLRLELRSLQDSMQAQEQQRQQQLESDSTSNTALTESLQARVRQLEEEKEEESKLRSASDQSVEASKSEKEELERKLRAAEQATQEANATIEELKAKVAAAAVAAPATANGVASKEDAGDGEDGEKTKEDLEKELEDLLILLDELSTKRKNDKKRMRQKGLDVSEDEDDDEGDDEVD